MTYPLNSPHVSKNFSTILNEIEVVSWQLAVNHPPDYGLRTTDYGLRTTDYGLLTTDY